MLFAEDSYINKELVAYQRNNVQPWIHRIVALKFIW